MNVFTTELAADATPSQNDPPGPYNYYAPNSGMGLKDLCHSGHMDTPHPAECPADVGVSETQSQLILITDRDLLLRAARTLRYAGERG